MTKNEIIERLARERVIERYTNSFFDDEELCKDLCQEVYLVLLEYDEASIILAQERGFIDKLAFRICKNTVSRKGRFYYQYLKWRNARSSIEETICASPDDD